MNLTTLIKTEQKITPQNIESFANSELTLDEIKQAVCIITGIDSDYLGNPTRKREIADSRHLYCWFARKRTSKSLREIGLTINRHHASVLHSVYAINDLMKYDYKLRGMIEKIDKIL